MAGKLREEHGAPPPPARDADGRWTEQQRGRGPLLVIDGERLRVGRIPHKLRSQIAGDRERR